MCLCLTHRLEPGVANFMYRSMRLTQPFSSARCDGVCRFVPTQYANTSFTIFVENQSVSFDRTTHIARAAFHILKHRGRSPESLSLAAFAVDWQFREAKSARVAVYVHLTWIGFSDKHDFYATITVLGCGGKVSTTS